jgi:ABC-type uncharacterized transport system fused permease/ATPase subunit
LSIHSNDTLVALLNAEQVEAEQIARRLKQAIEGRRLLQDRGRREIRGVQFHAVTFGEQASRLT